MDACVLPALVIYATTYRHLSPSIDYKLRSVPLSKMVERIFYFFLVVLQRSCSALFLEEN